MAHIATLSTTITYRKWKSISMQADIADAFKDFSSWASYQIRIIAGCACAGNAGNVSPHRRFQRKQLVSDPGMPHGTCVTHVPWCMSGSLTCGDGENVPCIPGACARAVLGIWQEAHGVDIPSAGGHEGGGGGVGVGGGGGWGWGGVGGGGGVSKILDMTV